jgi:hypothetical protein
MWVLIDHHHRLPDGRRVRLRLPHLGDAAGDGALEVRRALRARVAVCALEWDGAHEVLVGTGHLTDGGEQRVVAADPAVAALVGDALVERALSCRRVA